MNTAIYKKSIKVFFIIQFVFLTTNLLMWLSLAHAVAVTVPPAEIGPTPTVEIDNHGNVILDCIKRSLRHGVPEYIGPAGYATEDRLEFKIGAFSGELVFIERDVLSGFYLYKPKKEGPFLKFYYDNQKNSWRVYAQSGAIWELGVTAASRDESGGKTFMWFVTKLTDINKNKVLYDYLNLGSFAIGTGPKIKQIRYNFYGSKDEAFSVIDFNYISGSNTPRKLSYATGYRTVLDVLTLDKITVRAIGYDKSNNKTEDKRSTIIEYNIYQTKCADNNTYAFSQQIKKVSSDNKQHWFEYDYYPEPDKLDANKISGIKPIEHGVAKLWITEKFNTFKGANPTAKDTLDEWLNTSDIATLSQTFTTSVSIDSNKNITSWIQISHKLVDMDGDGDLDMLTANKYGWFWRKNFNGVWSQKDYLPVTFGYQAGDPAYIDPGFVGWGKQYAKLVDAALLDYEVSSNILQDVFDITGDGKADFLLVWISNRTLYVSKGNGQGFDRPQPWWVFPQDVPLSLGAVESRPVKTQIGHFSDVAEEKIKIIDLNGDNLADYLYVKEAGGQYSWNAYFNTGSGFTAKPVPILISPVHSGIKITQRIFYAVITVQDLFDVNGDKIPDLITAKHRDDPDKVFKSNKYNIVVFDQGFKNNNIFVYCGNGKGFDFSAPINFSQYPGMDRIETRMLSSANKEFRDHSGFYDINGDGLVDYLIAADFNYIRHIDPELKRIDPDWQDEASKAQKKNPGDLSAIYDKARIYVYYNKGGGYFSRPEVFFDIKLTGKDRNEFPVSLSAGDWVSSNYVIASYATARQAILDMNGDGQNEFVNCYSDWQENYNKLNKITIDPQKGVQATFSPTIYNKNKLGQWLLIGPEPKPTHRLQQVVTNKGQVTELQYSLGKENNRELPFPVWTIAKIKNSDLITHTDRILEMNNYFPVFDPEELEFRGFKTLEVIQIDPHNSASNRRTVHNYKTGHYDAGIEELTTVYANKPGSIQQYMVLRIDRSFEELHLDSFFNEFGGIKSPGNTYSTRVWVRPASVTIYLDDSQGYNDETKQSERYFSYEYWGSLKADKKYIENELGLIRRIIDKGDQSAGTKNRIIELEYKWINTNSAYAVRTKTQKLKDVSNKLYKEIKYDYDGYWNLIKEAELIDFSPMTYAETQYLNYDKYGRPGIVINPDYIETTYEYYSNIPYLAKVYQLDKKNQEYAFTFKDYHALSGQPRMIGGPSYKMNQGVKAWLTDYFEYDSLGRITSEYNGINFGDDKTKDLTIVREIEYFDSYSATTTPYRHTKVYPQGKSISASDVRQYREYINSFDQLIMHANSHPGGWVKKYISYNSFGEISDIFEAFLSNNYNLVLTEPSAYKAINFSYDKLGRPVGQRNFAGAKSKIEYAGNVISYFDEIDYIKNQPSMSLTLNGFNEIVSIAGDLNGKTVENKYSYNDITGVPETVTDADQGVFLYDYYANGGLKSVILPGGRQWSYSYKPAGLLKQIKRPDNSKTEFEFDELGRIKHSIIYDQYGNVNRQNIYDYYQNTQYLGQLKSVTDQEYHLTLEYGMNPHLVTETLVDRSTRDKLSAEYQNNLMGDLVEIHYPDQLKLKLNYDSAGNLWQISNKQTPNTVFGELEYYADGNIKKLKGYMDDVSGKLTFNRDYSYDINHLPSQQSSQVAHYQWATSFDYWQDGNIKSYVTKSNLGTTKIYGYQYEYDRFNRVTKAVAINPNPPFNSYEFSYNDNGTLDTVTENGDLWQYEYVNKQHHTLKKISLQGKKEYYLFKYGSSGQRQEELYEKSAGSLSTDSQHIFEWNPEETIHTITKKQGGLFQTSIDSKYTHAGERWKKTTQKGKTQTFSLYLNGLFELEHSSGGHAAKPFQPIYHDYIPIGDVSLILSSNGQKSLQFSDREGVSYVFSQNKTLLSGHAYSPYGRGIALGGLQDADVKYGYSGKERDGNVLFYGARHYDLVSRQFLSIDPLSKYGLNIENYLLGGANPPNRIDPDGRDYYDSVHVHHYINPEGPPFGADHYGPWSGIPGGAYVGPHDWLGSSNIHWFSGNRYIDSDLGKLYKGLNAVHNTAAFIINLVPNTMHKIAVAVHGYQEEMSAAYFAMSLYQAYITGGGNFSQLQASASKLATDVRSWAANIWRIITRTSRTNAQGFGTRYNTGQGGIANINCGHVTAAAQSEVPLTSTRAAAISGVQEGNLATVAHIAALFRRLGLGTGRYRSFNSVANAKRYMASFPTGYKFGVAYTYTTAYGGGHIVAAVRTRFGVFFRDFQGLLGLPRRQLPGAGQGSVIHVFPFHGTK